MNRAMRVVICIAWAVLLLPWGGALPANAQESLGAGIPENLAAGRSATDFNSRIRWRTGYLNLPGDAWLVPSRISGTWAADPSVALRIQIPLVYANTGGPESAFGIGDVSARILWRAWDHPRISTFVGLELFFPSAADPLLGSGKFVVSPIAGLVLKILDNLYFVPFYQQFISYAGSDARAELNVLRIRPMLVAAWPRKWWTLLDIGLLWDLEDTLPLEDTMTIGLEVGKQLTDQLSLSGKPSIQAYGTEDFAWALEFALTFRFD
jgi:hypothetical protein